MKLLKTNNFLKKHKEVRKYEEVIVILKCEYLADCFGNTTARSSFVFQKMVITISHSKIYFTIKITHFTASEK